MYIPDSDPRNHYRAEQNSFNRQVNQARNLIPVTIKDRILAGVYPLVEKGASRAPYLYTMKEFFRQTKDTIHSTLDRLDYNGLWPYIKLIDQVNKGIPFRDTKIYSGDELYGSTCAGMSRTIIKALRKNHGIDANFAVQKQEGHHFEHAAVIVECTDGFVLIDPRSDPKNRIFLIPFQTTVGYDGFHIKALTRGSSTPLTITYDEMDEYPELSFEYHTNILNGDDIVMKHFIMHVSTEFIPISLYNPDGSARKYILVIPSESKIILKNKSTTKDKESQTFSFSSILKGELKDKLEQFMAPDYVSLVPGFHIPFEVLYQQLYHFASQEETIKRLFQEANLNNTF